MMPIRLALLAVVASTALGASAAHSAPTAPAAKPAYTNAQLALMVLPKSQLGATAHGLDVKIGSGVRRRTPPRPRTRSTRRTPASSSRAAAGSPATGSTTTSSRSSGLERGRGVLAVGSSVDVFTSPAAADPVHRQAARRRQEVQRQVRRGRVPADRLEHVAGEGPRQGRRRDPRSAAARRHALPRHGRRLPLGEADGLGRRHAGRRAIGHPLRRAHGAAAREADEAGRRQHARRPACLRPAERAQGQAAGGRARPGADVARRRRAAERRAA